MFNKKTIENINVHKLTLKNIKKLQVNRDLVNKDSGFLAQQCGKSMVY